MGLSRYLLVVLVTTAGLLLTGCGPQARSPMVGVWKSYQDDGPYTVRRTLTLRGDGSASFRVGYKARVYTYPGKWDYLNDELRFTDIKGGSTPLRVVVESDDELRLITPAGMVINLRKSGGS